MTTENVCEKSIRLLVKYVRLLKGDISNNILKSYYISRCKKLCNKENYSVPKVIFDTTKRCSKCYTAYSDCCPSYKILKHSKRNRFTRRLIKKIQNKTELTSFQAKISKSLQKNKETVNSNTLLITCNVCHNKGIILLEKPVPKLSNIAHQIDQKKKKRKRKDHLAGLNAKYVLSNNKHKNSMLNIQPVEINSKKKVKQKRHLLTNVMSKVDTSIRSPSYSLGDFLSTLSK